MNKYTQKTNRLLPVLLALAVFVLAGTPVFAGGGQSGAAAGRRPALAEQATGKLTQLNVMQMRLANQQVDFANLWFYQTLERETGVHVNWDVVLDSNWEQQINLRFASMDLPDVFRTGYINAEVYGVQQGLLVALNPYLYANMPNYAARIYMNDSDKAMVSSDGNFYFIGNVTAQNVNHTGNHYINKTWLDRLGLAIPKTVNELTDVLKAFRDRAPNGNAATVLPMSGGGDQRAITDRTQGLAPHFAMFGVPFHEDNRPGGYANVIPAQKKVQFVTDYPGFRAAVEWLAMCYSERLLDMESLTQNANDWAVKVNAGRVGFFSYLRMINSAMAADTIPNFVSIIPPAATGYQVQVPRQLEVPRADTYVSIANKYVAQTLQWLDRQLETERMMIGVNGPMYTGAPIPPTLQRLPDGRYDIISVPDNNGLYSVVPVYHALFFAPGDYYFPIYNMPPHRVERFETSKAYADAGVLEPGSSSYLDTLIMPYISDAEELARLYVDIDTLMQESLATFIRTGVTDANWNQFMTRINQVGVPRYISMLQDAYNKYSAGQ